MTFGQPQVNSGLSLNLSQSGAPMTNGYVGSTMGSTAAPAYSG